MNKLSIQDVYFIIAAIRLIYQLGSDIYDRFFHNEK